MGNETQKPEQQSQPVNLEELNLPPGRRHYLYRYVQAMFRHAVERGLGQDGEVQRLYPDSFDIADDQGRHLAMKAAHEVETGSDGEPITDTHAIECRTEFKQVTRVLRAEYNGMTHDYKMYFGSTDRLAKSPNVSDGEKVDIHLTRARYILDTVLSEEDDTEADDRAHLAAAQSVLQMVMEDSVSVADSADEPPTPNAHVIDIFSRKKRQ